MNVIPATGYTPQRATAIHESGHAVMAYLLGRPFTSISVVEDGDSLGRVHSDPPGEWFRPDIEVNARTRTLIEDRVMICLAGAAAEEAWAVLQPDAPDGWRDEVNRAAAHDYSAAIDLASYVTDGDVPELEAYVEWLRQRVLGNTGRGPDFDVTAFSPGAPAFVVSHYREGSKRFWTLVSALAEAATEAGELTWRNARAILRAADTLTIPASSPFAETTTDTTERPAGA